MRTPIFAVLVGSLQEGFSIAKIETDQRSAEDLVVKALANGKLAEWMEVLPPSTSGASADDETGKHFIALDSGFGSGLSLYGPFEFQEDAHAFGVNQRGEQDWEIWTSLVEEPSTERSRG